MCLCRVETCPTGHSAANYGLKVVLGLLPHVLESIIAWVHSSCEIGIVEGDLIFLLLDFVMLIVVSGLFAFANGVREEESGK